MFERSPIFQTMSEYPSTYRLIIKSQRGHDYITDHAVVCSALSGVLYIDIFLTLFSLMIVIKLVFL